MYRRGAAVNRLSSKRIYHCGNGIRLQTVEAINPKRQNTIIIIPGLFGHANSSYVLSLAAHLWASGCNVVRIHLRDHGGTEHLNKDLYHSVRVVEVAELLLGIQRAYAHTQLGVVGFSMGANIAIRTMPKHRLPVLAVCPLVDPAAAVTRIDAQAMYRFFFVRKWQRQVRAKMRAFPSLYDFSAALSLRSLGALSDYFVSRGTEFRSVEDYFRAHTLQKADTNFSSLSVVFAEDDPVIEKSEILNVFDKAAISSQPFGGHCAFIDNLLEASWLDQYVLNGFVRTLSQ